MSKIKIMTDSSVQLSPEEIEKYGITVVPLSVTIDGHTYTDGVDITRADFIQKMDEAEKLPKTSQPPVGLFVERMEELTADGSEVLGIFMAKTLSGTVDSARQAAEMVAGKITVIDCGYTDRSQGYYCIEAAKDAAFTLGVSRGIDPFMTLSFMALPVIPKLRITTRGVVDVDTQQYV